MENYQKLEKIGEGTITLACKLNVSRIVFLILY